MEIFGQLKTLKPITIMDQITSLILIVSSAIALWKLLCIGFYTECPVVVVLTGSMEPGYYRGDILVVTHWDQPLIPGDTVVYNTGGMAIPIVHRVITTYQKPNGDLDIMTKGDNNPVDDRGLYPPTLAYLNRKHLMGKMRAYIPYMGMFTIWLNDYPLFKFGVLGMMGLLTLLAKDPQ